MLDSINNIALLLGVAQGLFLALLLRQRHWKLYANRFLAALMAVYGIVLLQLLMQDVGFFARYPKLWLVLSGLPLVTGPLHYLYARHLIHPELRFRRAAVLHFLPFIIYKLTEFPLLFESDSSVALLLADVAGEAISVRFFYFNWIIVLQGVLYMGWTLLMLLRHARGLEEVVSSAHYLRLTWLRNITLLALIAWTLFMTEYALYLAGIPLADRFGISGILGGVLVYVMGYMGLSRSEVLEAPASVTSMTDLSVYREKMELGNRNTREAHTTVGTRRIVDIPGTGDTSSGQGVMADISTADASTVPYAKSGLTENKAREIAERVNVDFEGEHVYRDSGLTLPALAARLDVSPHNLSEAINTQFHMNFFDLVNGYRVREVQQRLLDPEARQFTILAIAFDAGFNSKTSFNTIFKKHAGRTPSEYRDRQ
jgi:AraC-like DNA-binding protein